MATNNSVVPSTNENVIDAFKRLEASHLRLHRKCYGGFRLFDLDETRVKMITDALERTRPHEVKMKRTQPVCSRCEHPLPEGAKYCPECGTLLSWKGIR